MKTKYKNLFDLTDKVAIVTGASKGIGASIAKAFAEFGANVVVSSRSQEGIEKVVSEITANGYNAIECVCHVGEDDQLKNLIETTINKYGRIDILVNNAGIGIRTKEPQELTEDNWRTVIETNLSSVHYFSSLIIDQMKEKGSGKIINIGSMFSIFGGAHASVYAASKGGVVQYTKSCAVAWIKYGIQVNAILPGYITTNLTDGFKEFFPEEANLVTTRIPAGRLSLIHI